MTRLKHLRSSDTQKGSRFAQLVRIIRQRYRFIARVFYHHDGTAELSDGITATFMLKLDHCREIQVPFHVGESEETVQRYVENHPLVIQLGMPVVVMNDQTNDLDVKQQIVAFLRYHKGEQTDFSSIYRRATYLQKRRREERLYQLRDTESRQELRTYR